MSKIVLTYIIFGLLLWYAFYQWNEQLAMGAV